MDENTLLDMDFQGLSDSDLTVLFAIGDEPILKTRLQKIALLFDEMNDSHGLETERGLRFFGGYSDEIDESTITLTSAGIIDETSHRYVMTDYGKKLKEYTERCIKNDRDETGITIIRGIRNIVRSLDGIPDKNVVGLTYRYYPDTAARSAIKESVDILNRTAIYNGKSLSKMPREEFEDILRRGEELRIGRCHCRELRDNRPINGPNHLNRPSFRQIRYNG